MRITAQITGSSNLCTLTNLELSGAFELLALLHTVNLLPDFAGSSSTHHQSQTLAIPSQRYAPKQAANGKLSRQ